MNSFLFIVLTSNIHSNMLSNFGPRGMSFNLLVNSIIVIIITISYAFVSILLQAKASS